MSGNIRNMKKKMVLRVLKHWNLLLREAVEPPSLEILKKYLNMALSKYAPDEAALS